MKDLCYFLFFCKLYIRIVKIQGVKSDGLIDFTLSEKDMNLILGKEKYERI